MSGWETPDEWAENCPSCARAVKEREAAEGLRCANCLESFDKRYPFQSEEDETLCNGCYRVAQAPKFPAVGAYGTAAPQRRPESTETAQEPVGRGLDADGGDAA